MSHQINSINLYFFIFIDGRHLAFNFFADVFDNDVGIFFGLIYFFAHRMTQVRIVSGLYNIFRDVLSTKKIAVICQTTAILYNEFLMNLFSGARRM